MISPADVTAIVVTRGDVDTSPVIASLACFDEVIVWNNAEAPRDLGVYGRYAAIQFASHQVIYVQDDDCLLDPSSLEALCVAYEPGALVANMPARFRDHYTDSCLVGFGSLFAAELPEETFVRFLGCEHGEGIYASKVASPGEWLAEHEPTFKRTCDVVFTALHERLLLEDVPYLDREFASDASRMWRQAGHVGERAAMLGRARACR